MDQQRFGELTKQMAGGASRRAVFGAFAGIGLAAVGALVVFERDMLTRGDTAGAAACKGACGDVRDRCRRGCDAAEQACDDERDACRERCAGSSACRAACDAKSAK
ncbi:MAG TPA: hypothetical protein VFU81_06320, partial [Thermomicrobiales bacterium]|nr:hypothetical protein [Thermomicrobiales bacterium]